MTVAGLRPPPTVPTTQLEPARTPRRRREDPPYAQKHAAFSPRATRAPPDLRRGERAR